MPPSSSAADIVVEGRVQGVGYRAWVERQAARFGLVGYVVNLEDGRVRVHVEGDRTVIEGLIQSLAQGPRLARVERTDVSWSDATGRFRSFDVRYAGDVR